MLVQEDIGMIYYIFMIQLLPSVLLVILTVFWAPMRREVVGLQSNWHEFSSFSNTANLIRMYTQGADFT